MITIKQLKELIADIPDDVQAIAYEGEGIGISLNDPSTDSSGWIETGWNEQPADETKHDIRDVVRGSEKFTPLPSNAEIV